MKTAAPEKKSVKTLKGQLFGAVSMMLVAAIALGTSTYAWFINNSVAAVEEMNLTVSTSTSMLVALQKRDDTTGARMDPTVEASWTGYKSSISNADITGTDAQQGGWTDFLVNAKTTMTPASVSSYSLAQATPNFYMTDNHVTDGKLDQFVRLADNDTLTADNSAVDQYGIGQGPVKRLGLKFLASNNVSVYFGQNALENIADMITPKHVKTLDQINDAANAANKDDDMLVYNAETAQAAAVRAALRVAVVSKNETDVYTDGKAVVFQFDAGQTGAGAAAANNTDYQYVTDLYNNITGTGPTTPTDPKTEVPAIINEKGGIYAAIKTADPAKSNHVTAVEQLVTNLPTAKDNGYLASVDKDGAVKAPTTAAAKLFELTATKPRQVDLYIWLEGTDNECLNSLSGFNFNIVVPFAAVPKP